MDEPKIAVICVYNNYEQLSSQLKASLDKQDIKYQFIPIDNTKKQFSSAAAAMNYAATNTGADIIVFSHQDVYIKETDGLRKFAQVIWEGKIGNIYGSSGTKETEKKNIGAYTSGSLFNEAIIITDDSPVNVSCLDECFFGMKRETYVMYNGFDEIVCNNWHLYCVELCLKARCKGHSVYMVPTQIHHFSNGTISNDYMNCLLHVAKKYRKHFKYIWTTAYKVKTNPIYLYSLVFAWKFNRTIIQPLFKSISK